MSQQAMQQALEALRAVVSVADRATAEFDLARTAIATLEKELALHTAGASGQIVYADKIAFESAMREGKGCDVWPKAGDYTARTGRALVALQVLAPPAIEANDAKDAARYRWLREQEWFSGTLCVLRDPKRVLTSGIGLGADCPSHHRLDAAIDAAMSTHQPKESGNG